MEALKLYLVGNKDWLFPVVGVFGALLAWFIKHQRDKPRSTGATTSVSGGEDLHNQRTEVIVNNNIAPASLNYAPMPLAPAEAIGAPTKAVVAIQRPINDEASKDKTTILFIDDDKDFKIVSMLKKAGWKRVSIIEDVDRVDAEKIRAADIIFVDIQGVGKRLGFAREGLGLMKAIKERYPAKKVVIYSGVPTHDIFAEELAFADERLRKSAEFIEFEKTIEDLL